MGAWGIGIFENDDSCDWLYDLEKSTDLLVIESALNHSDADYIEAPEGCCILAAAEIIIALQGNAKEGLPENAASWVSQNSSLMDTSHLNIKAIQAIDKVLSDVSELKELWEETDDFKSWVEDVEKIKAALLKKIIRD
ncbi:DUF4259 domain-containing protein [Desulfobacterales bacterium HSG17]|nr:DUF4259 domain-containing protein [Desulfobacterales bacterium HSG17]